MHLTPFCVVKLKYDTRHTGGARTFLLTSPHAPRVVPMFLMTVENTVFRSCFSTACSWYVCRVVSLSVSLPNCIIPCFGKQALHASCSHATAQMNCIQGLLLQSMQMTTHCIAKLHGWSISSHDTYADKMLLQRVHGQCLSVILPSRDVPATSQQPARLQRCLTTWLWRIVLKLPAGAAEMRYLAD